MTIDRNEHLIAIGRVSGPVIVLVTALAFYLWYSGRISGLAALGLIAMGPLLGIGLGYLISKTSTFASKAIAHTITAAQGIPPAPSYSHPESLVARGAPDLAREEYERHLVDHPEDLAARFALASLWRNELRNPEKAIEQYLELRRRNPDPNQELAIANGLIDLYQATGRRGRAMAELGRLAERFAGTDAAARAREALRRLKEAG